MNMKKKIATMAAITILAATATAGAAEIIFVPNETFNFCWANCRDDRNTCAVMCADTSTAQWVFENMWQRGSSKAEAIFNLVAYTMAEALLDVETHDFLPGMAYKVTMVEVRK
jgi:hypothetical protein